MAHHAVIAPVVMVSALRVRPVASAPVVVLVRRRTPAPAVAGLAALDKG